MEEVCGTLPAVLGRFIEERPRLHAWLDRRINKGRRIRTDSLGGFLALWMLSALKPFRHRTLRHVREMVHLEEWLAVAYDTLDADYDLAVEIVKCRRLIKGYSDTYKRGSSKFDRVLSGVPLLKGRGDGADWLRRLRESALLDEDGIALDGALKTIRTFSGQ
jgi:indolepyruvate ferredoxin oxidoreductase beta subunit